MITAVILACFFGFTILKTQSGKNKIKYPVSTDCSSISSLFLNVSDFEKYADLDEAPTNNNEGLGFYQCYCKQYKSVSAELCKTYSWDYLLGLATANSVTFLISVVNIVLRTVNISLITKVGLPTESLKTSMIMKSIFFTSFVNTGIILLLTNADFRFSVLKFIPINNQYADFDKNWYLDIAPSLIQTMLIYAFFPYIEICMYGGMKKLS